MRALYLVLGAVLFLIAGASIVMLVKWPSESLETATQAAQIPVQDKSVYLVSDTSGLRIGILDFSRIHRDAKAIKSIDETYRSAIQAYARDAKEREAELREAEDELRRLQGEISTDEQRRERSRLQRRMARAMELVQEQKRSLDLARQEGLNKVQLALNEIVYEIAEEKALSLILRKEQTVLVAVDFEITEEVLRRLNERLPSIGVLAPEN